MCIQWRLSVTLFIVKLTETNTMPIGSQNKTKWYMGMRTSCWLISVTLLLSFLLEKLDLLRHWKLYPTPLDPNPPPPTPVRNVSDSMWIRLFKPGDSWVTDKGFTPFYSLSISWRREQSFNKKPRRQQILFYDIQIKVVISRRQIYVYHTDLLPVKIRVTWLWPFKVTPGQILQYHWTPQI